MRGHKFIDYTQLGLEYILTMYEVTYNLSISLKSLGNIDESRKELNRSLKWLYGNDLKTKHIKSSIDALVMFPLIIYLPCMEKLMNVGEIDYLGKSNVLASVDSNVSYRCTLYLN